MEVLLGPTFTIEVPPPTAFVRAQTDVSLPQGKPAAPCIFVNGKEEEIQTAIGSGFGVSGSGSSLDDASSGSSSSIGVPDDDSGDDAGEEVQSKLKGGGFCGLDSLEDALPIKRGLSNHFSGKSKSFANLSEVVFTSQVKDLEKPENPFNKRRRILMASKWARKSSFYNWPNPKSMPLLALNEDEDEEEGAAAAQDPSEEKEEESDEDEEDELRRRARKFHDRKLHSFKSRSCYDLQEYEQL